MLKSLAHTFSHHSQLPLFRTRTLSLFFRRALSNSTKSRIRRVFTAVTHTHSHTRTTVQNECAENLHKMLSERVPVPVCVCVRVCASSSLLVWHQTVSACQNRHVVHVSFPVAWLEMRAATAAAEQQPKSVCNIISQWPWNRAHSPLQSPHFLLPFSHPHFTQFPPSAFFVCLQHKSYCTHRQVEQTDGRGEYKLDICLHRKLFMLLYYMTVQGIDLQKEPIAFLANKSKAKQGS